MAGKAIDGAQQFAHPGRIGDGGVVLVLGWLQRTPKAGGGVGFGLAFQNRPAEHLPRLDLGALGCFQFAGFLDLAQGRQQHPRRNLGQRQGAYLGEQEGFHDPPRLAQGDIRAVLPRQPCQRHRLEGVARRLGCCHLGGLHFLPPGTGVDTIRQQGAGFVALLAGFAQGNIRVGVKGEDVLPSVWSPVLPAPPLRAARLHQQEQAAPVRHAVRLGLRLGIRHGGRGERIGEPWHVDNSASSPFPREFFRKLFPKLGDGKG